MSTSMAGPEPDLPNSFEYEACTEPVIAPFHYDRPCPQNGLPNGRGPGNGT